MEGNAADWMHHSRRVQSQIYNRQNKANGATEAELEVAASRMNHSQVDAINIYDQLGEDE